MTLTPGTRLGPYEIVAPLGAGGMGEVYRAKDTRLGREVAVKVLPQHLSANAEIRARFEREAKTISSLNHPHICTLFDVGREGDVDFLVMELVDGETLAQRIARVGALPTPDVLKFGAQIADALDRAHRAGVVHRDLKPGNIMLTKAGAKLMDFGLARATEASGPASASGVTMAALTVTATHASPLTAEGTLVGTFQYMAPEQLEGQEADARADLWALGCVLYEMATGKRAFDGRSQASLIGAIMTTEPAPVSQVAPLAPAGLDRLVRTCLTKDPDERVRTAHDIRLQLEGIAEGASVSGVAITAPQRKRQRAWLPWAIAAAGVLAAVVTLAWSLSHHEATGPIRATIDPPAGVTLGARWSFVALSPDGQSIAFWAADSTRRSLWVRPLGSLDARRLLDSPFGYGTGLFWSADSRTLGYFDSGMHKMMKVGVDGGTPTEICDATGGRGGSWNKRGDLIFSGALEGPLFRVRAGDDAVTPLTTLDAGRHEVGHRFPCFLPDGNHFLYAALPAGPHGFNIFAGSLSSKAVKLVFTAECAPVYAAPGYLVFRRDGHIVAQRFDARRLSVHGTPVVLAVEPPLSDIDSEPVVSASRNGRLAFLRSEVPNARLRWFDRGGVAGADVAVPPGQWGVKALSPDGTRAVASLGNDLWLVDLARAVPTRFASVATGGGTAQWSPDGTQIAYTSLQSGTTEVYIARADGSGTPRRIASTGAQFVYINDWSPDGTALVVRSISPETGDDLWMLPANGAGRPVTYLRTPYNEYGAKISPDGRWLAYTSTESGTREVYIQSFPAAGHKVRVTTDGGEYPWWSQGGHELQYNSLHGERWAVPIESGVEIMPGTPHKLFAFAPRVTGGVSARDGDRYLFSLATDVPHRDMQLFVNWTEGLPR